MAQPKLRVCVLASSYEGSQSTLAAWDDFVNNPKVYYKPEQSKYELTEFAYEQLFKASAARRVRELAQQYDAFVNLCDGAFDEDRAGAEVVAALERFGCVFTGADTACYELSKPEMKLAVCAAGVRTAAHVVATNADDIEEAVSTLTFPVITKHPSGYSSVAMTRASRCTTAEELRAEATRFVGLFGSVLIEEFVDGGEFTVLVAEGPEEGSAIALEPIECVFPKGETFKHFELKWEEYNGMHWIPVADEGLRRKLKDLAERSFVACNSCGYARVDIRVDSRDGEPVFLELNPNMGVFYPPGFWGSADYILGTDKSHGGEDAFTWFIDTIIEAAINHRNKRCKPWEVKSSKKRGFYISATRDIKEGETVVRLDGEKHRLLTKSALENATRPEWQQKWLCEGAWNITEDIFLCRDMDPREWKPINHSCDPNAWFCTDSKSGVLSIQSRRPIRKGEEITLDYAMIGSDVAEPFKCWCGTANCRGEVTGTDYKKVFLVNQYQGHVSPFVACWHGGKSRIAFSM